MFHLPQLVKYLLPSHLLQLRKVLLQLPQPLAPPLCLALDQLSHRPLAGGSSEAGDNGSKARPGSGILEDEQCRKSMKIV